MTVTRIFRAEAWRYDGKYYETRQEAVEAKLADFLRQNLENSGPLPLAQFILENLHAIKEIADEAREDQAK